MASAPLWKLRRLASRAKRVQIRRATEAPAVAAYGPTLLPKADAFITTYDAATRYDARWSKEMGEGKGAIAALVTAIRAWLPLVARDVPGFDASTFADKPDVPDDVLEDGERLLSVVDEHVDGSGAPLGYRPGAVAALGTALAAAQKEWAEADEADATYQKMLQEVRTTAAVFDVELQAFRRTLSTVFGRSSKDFQKLRVERASHADEEDDGGAPPPAQR